MSPLVDSVTVFVPDDTALLEPSPQPLVPPTAMVPASATPITTSGVASLVGDATAVLSVAAATVVSNVGAGVAPTIALHASA